MKRLILISLLIISFCKAADVFKDWNLAVGRMDCLQIDEEYLMLEDANITAIPESLD